MTRRSPRDPLDLSRRERQALEILYELGSATAAELHARLPDPPSYSSVRSLLRLLEEKGRVEHERDGPRYLYRPTLARDDARVHALRNLLQTFFEGSTRDAVAALLDQEGLDPTAVQRIVRSIERAKKEGR